MLNIDIDVLLGKTLIKIDGEVGSDEIIFHTSDEKIYKQYHDQDCCENVSIEDINGDWENLLNTPIVLAEETTSRENPVGITPPEHRESFTWTFYRLSTNKGMVIIRWYGESNGYYSEKVNFAEITNLIC